LKRPLAGVRAVYEELAKRRVECFCQACTGCCRFQLTGLTPHLTKGEALVAAQGLRATGRNALAETDEATCPLRQRATGSCLI